MIQTKLKFGNTTESKLCIKRSGSTKVASWNVNGLKSILCKDRSGVKHSKVYKYNPLHVFIQEVKPDILCLQEIRCSSKFETLSVWFPHVYWNFSTDKKGYSGTLIASKQKPLSILYDIEGVAEKHGRVITAEFETFVLINVYAPNTGGDMEKLQYRTKLWEPCLLKHVLTVQAKFKKQIVLVGDLNCVSNIDWDVSSTVNRESLPGASYVETKCFDTLLTEAKLCDSFRTLFPEKKQFSWIPPYDLTKKEGVRLDYCLISKNSKIEDSAIHEEYSGSDHVPISITFML